VSQQHPEQPPGRDAPLEVVLHQERAALGLTRLGLRAVVRRRIVSEVRQVEVTVRREVLEVEHLPLDPSPDGSVRDLPAPGRTTAPLTFLLSEEVPVVSVETRPYERVTVAVETVTESQEVSATVGTEQAELSTDDRLQRLPGRPVR
jgi:stress response protein YsnF